MKLFGRFIIILLFCVVQLYLIFYYANTQILINSSNLKESIKFIQNNLSPLQMKLAFHKKVSQFIKHYNNRSIVSDEDAKISDKNIRFPQDFDAQSSRLFQGLSNATKSNSQQKFTNILYQQTFQIKATFQNLSSKSKLYTKEEALKSTHETSILSEFTQNLSSKSKRRRLKPTIHSNSSQSYTNQNPINIFLQFLDISKHAYLQKSFLRLMFSIVSQTNSTLVLYINCGVNDKKVAETLLTDVGKNVSKMPKRIYLDEKVVTEELNSVILNIHHLFKSDNHSYYTKAFFITPVALHRVSYFRNITKMIMFDIDMELYTDIKNLYLLFKEMKPSNLLGLVREQQPVYRHVLYEYRKKYPRSPVGGSPPRGLSGYNSGTKLINLDALRQNKIYNAYLDEPNLLKSFADKFYFQGHLGDQDLYSLLSFYYPDMFYELPCQWNRQLCQWWRRGYSKVFDQYFNCTPPYFVIHGNCNTTIP